MKKRRLENAGMLWIAGGTTIMILALIVAYFGGAIAMKPELVNLANLRWVLALMAVGTIANIVGLVCLNSVESPDKIEPFPPNTETWS